MTIDRSLAAAALALLCQTFIACGGGGGKPATHADGGPDTPGVVTPSGPGTVYGIVTDIGTGAGIPGVMVTGGGQSGTTDGQGTFSLSGLAPGPVNLTINNSE